MRKKYLYFPVVIFLSVFLLSSCNGYNKLLRSNDQAKKISAAKDYFQKGNYAKALPLLEDVSNFVRGTTDEEEIMYDLAYTYYRLEQFQLASFQFRTFALSYPASVHADEAFYLYAYGLYQQSPKKDLDQSSSVEAINAFQEYLNRYPNTEKVEDVNKYIDELYAKIEAKNIENAVLYYKIQDYKAAVWALKNVLEMYPAASNKEYLEYLIVRSGYLLAKNSVPEKQKERYLLTEQYYNDFKDRYPNSKYDEDLKRILKDTHENLLAIKK